MPTPQEKLAAFQEIADANRQGELPAKNMAIFNALVESGDIALPKTAGSPRAARAQQAQQQRISDRDQFIASLPAAQREQIENMSPLDAAFIAAGGGLTNVMRGVGVMDQPDAREIEAKQQLETAFPTATTVGEVAGEAAPFIAPGLGVAGIVSTPLRVAGTALLGGAEGQIITRGAGGSVENQIIAAGIGSTIAGAMELGVPVLGRVGGKVFRRITGKSPKGAVIDAAGNPSDEFLAALRSEGLEFQDVVDDSIKDLRRQAVDPEAAARKSFLESQGLVGDAGPTRAQITRSVDDFALQQEALKSSGRVEKRLAAQDRVLTSRFDNAIEETAGNPFAPVSSVNESLLNKANVLDAEIGRLYKEARELAPGDKVVRFDNLSKKIKELAPLNDRAGGNIRAVFGTMQEKGLLDDNIIPTGRISIEQTETQIRQLMNELYDQNISGGDIKNAVLRQMKDALDDDVFAAVGDDMFDQARSAKHSFETELTRAKISKFDSRKKNIVRDMLENKDSVNPEVFTNNVVFTKNWKSTDLQQLKDYITTEGHGKAAWNDLRADVLQKIKERSFIGPEDGSGFQSLSRDKIGKAISAVGDLKLEILFSPDEIKFLKNMERVAKFREPRKMVGQGFGPSAKAVLELEKQMTGFPVAGGVFGVLKTDRAGRLATRAKPSRLSVPFEGSVVRQAIGLGTAGAAIDATAGEE